jgi:outer membrane protein TolC
MHPMYRTLGLYTLICLTAFAVGGSAVSAAPVGKEKPSERLRELQRERVKALEEQLQGQFERVKIGRDPMVTLLDALRELTEAELDLADSPAAEVAVLERSLGRHREVEDEVAKLVAAGLQTKQGAAQVRAARLRVEVQLEKRKLSK